MNQPMTLPQKSLVIHILNGPDKGAQFKISGVTLTIGRGTESDIQINGDPKISRQHLRIFIRNGEIYIESLNKKNPIYINGRPVEKAIVESDVIESGLKFMAGKTQFEISEESKKLSAQKNNHHMGHHIPSPHPPKRTPTRLILYSIIVIVVLLLVISSKKKENTEEPSLRTEEKVNEELATQQEVIESLKRRRLQSGKSTIQFKKAQAGYIKGFRDYKQGQHERAMQYFQECLSIYPSHILCNRYLGLAQKRFNELIQYHMVVGKKFLDKKQYQACIKSFHNVMVMVDDPSDKVYLEARSNYEICKLSHMDRF